MPTPAHASATLYESPTIDDPVGITVGPDGALWFTNAGNNSIGRITTSGVVTSYTDPSISGPWLITVGPDEALWFTNFTGNSIGRITTSGVVTNYTDPSISEPGGITTGLDGAVWFTNVHNNSIGRITTSGVVTNYTDPSMSAPSVITTGPDGALWFTNQLPINSPCCNTGSIGRITTSGSVSDYTVPYTDPRIFYPWGITSGPDGALWFANGNNGNPGGNTGSIGRITTSGEITSYTDPSIVQPNWITTGANETLWFTNYGNGERTGTIGWITTSAVVGNEAEKSLNEPWVITTGPDKAMWFTSKEAIGGFSRLSPPGASLVSRFAGSGPIHWIGRLTLNGPAIKKLSPKKGPASGGTSVTITATKIGTNFTGATRVKFGSIAAAAFKVNSPTSITAISPSEPKGTVNVTVMTPHGVSAISTKDHFKFK